MFDFLKNFQNMRLGDPTMFAPKGAGGWQTGVQTAGSPFSMTPDGAFAGFNPKVSDIGKAMQGAAGQMPGGAQVVQSMGQQDQQAPQASRPQSKNLGAFAPSDQQQSPGPAAWLKPFTGA